MLSLRGLNVHYGKIHALRDLSLSVAEGEAVSVVGANGAGKSTLMWTLAGVLRPTSGEILFRGAPLAARAHEVVRSGLSLVPERRRLFAELSVEENLVMGGYLRHDEALGADRERMLEMFPILRQRLGQTAGTLSGGEQQMLAIARALMGRPRMLLLDEPTLGLAPLMVDQVMETLDAVRREGTPLLLVEQNAQRALELADRAYVLETGSVVREGPARELLDDPVVRRAYLGDLA